MIETSRLEQVRVAADMEALDGGAEVSEAEASWYVATCADDCDAKAMRWLVRKHFGIFQPIMRVRRERYSGKRANGSHRMVEVREPAFPGYLFVRVWDIGKMRERILSCPGVDGLLSQGGRPWPIPDDFIGRLYALDWIADGSTAGEHAAVSGRRNRRKPRKSNKLKRSCQLTEGLINAGSLAAPERISQLMASLPLISP